MKTQEKNFDGIKLSGFTAILIMLALTGTAIYLLSLPQTPSIIAGVICGICVVVMLPGFMIIQPNNSRVLTFFGRYAGTVISNGFYWVNPLFLKSTVTLRILNLNIDPIKVNDKVGNPIMIGRGRLENKRHLQSQFRYIRKHPRVCPNTKRCRSSASSRHVCLRYKRDD